MEKEAKEVNGILSMKVIPTNSEIVKEANNRFNTLRENDSLLDFHNNLRTSGVMTYIHMLGAGGWHIFTTSDGKSVTRCQAICRDMKYVIIANISKVSKKAVIRADIDALFTIDACLKQIFTYDEKGLTQLVKEYPDGWKFPLFDSKVCAC